MQTNFRVPGSL